MRNLGATVATTTSTANVALVKRLGVKASGSQLREITRLFDAGVMRPVIDRVFPFESTNEAMTYVEAGHAKGKVVVSVK